MPKVVKGIIEYLFQDGEQILYLLNIQVMIYIDYVE